MMTLAELVAADPATAGAALVCGTALPLAALAYYRNTSSNDQKVQSSFSMETVSSSNSSCACCHPDLKEHSKLFRKQVIHVPDTNVYVAIGYSLANCIMLEGDDGLVIIDTTESTESAAAVLKEFRKLVPPTKPIRAIICTHFHHDHVGGTQTFVEEAMGMTDEGTNDRMPEIWAHCSTGDRITQFNSVMGPIAYKRAAKMYGTQLDQPELENCGIGPFLQQMGDNEAVGFRNLPTHTYRGNSQTINVAGIQLELIHAPGETDDQTVVFYPKHQVLFAADNYYESFPNLYTIRGAPNRDVLQWARSLDIMMETTPSIMIPSHTLPVYGRDNIQQRLQEYRDAMQYVHDQTVRKMLQGHHPDQIAHDLRLPNTKSEKEHLKEYYGTVGWSAKSIFDSYLGWYSGDECDLLPLPPVEKSKRLIDLAGGDASKVLDKAQQALDQHDDQWALELSSAVLRTNDTLRHSRQVVRRAAILKSQACIALGTAQINANARNWYITAAKLANPDDDLNKIRLPPNMRRQFFQHCSFDQIFSGMCIRYKAEQANKDSSTPTMVRFVIYPSGDSECKEKVAISQQPPKEVWTLMVRNSVLYANRTTMLEDEEKPDASTTASVVIVEGKEHSIRNMFVNPKSFLAKNMFQNENDRITLSQGSWMQLGKFFANVDRDL